MAPPALDAHLLSPSLTPHNGNTFEMVWGFGCRAGHVLEGARGLAGTPLEGLPMVPAEGGPKILKLKSSWHRSKILAVSLQHWKGRGGGRGV